MWKLFKLPAALCVVYCAFFTGPGWVMAASSLVFIFGDMGSDFKIGKMSEES